MSTVFEQFIERRREVREMLDHFSTVIGDFMLRLANDNPLVDPVNDQPLLRVDKQRAADGSIHVALIASSGRALVFYFQSNGEARVVQSIGDSPLSDEYIDLTQKADGEATLATETEEVSIEEYVLRWVLGAFED